ncbi:hypothetical protein PCE1_004895 [Barthelona sp. PCE]
MKTSLLLLLGLLSFALASVYPVYRYNSYDVVTKTTEKGSVVREFGSRRCSFTAPASEICLVNPKTVTECIDSESDFIIVQGPNFERFLVDLPKETNKTILFVDEPLPELDNSDEIKVKCRNNKPIKAISTKVIRSYIDESEFNAADTRVLTVVPLDETSLIGDRPFFGPSSAALTSALESSRVLKSIRDNGLMTNDTGFAYIFGTKLQNADSIEWYKRKHQNRNVFNEATVIFVLGDLSSDTFYTTAEDNKLASVAATMNGMIRAPVDKSDPRHVYIDTMNVTADVFYIGGFNGMFTTSKDVSTNELMLYSVRLLRMYAMLDGESVNNVGGSYLPNANRIKGLSHLLAKKHSVLLGKDSDFFDLVISECIRHIGEDTYTRSFNSQFTTRLNAPFQGTLVINGGTFSYAAFIKTMTVYAFATYFET